MVPSGGTDPSGTIRSGTIRSGMTRSGDPGVADGIGAGTIPSGTIRSGMIPGMGHGGLIIPDGTPTDRDPGIRTDRFIPDITYLSRLVLRVFPEEGI